MRVRRGIGGVALACLLVGPVVGGCGDDGSGEGTTTIGAEPHGGSSGGEVPNEAPTAVGEIDVAAACGRAGATRVELHATRVGCIDPPPSPCTLPEIPRVTVGEGIDCPAESSPQALRVELVQTGRYHVEALTLAGEAELSRVCYGEDGAKELLINDARLNGKPTLTVESLDGSACG